MEEEHRQRPQRTRRGFTKAFKRDAVELVRSTGRPIAQVARELGIYDSTLATGYVRTASTVASKRG
jgi:transposase-like protein